MVFQIFPYFKPPNVTLKSTEHTVHEQTASIAQLIIQGMEVLKTSNTQN